MAGNYSRAARAFVARNGGNSGPVGDTKFDIFDVAGLSRAQMKALRTGKVRRPAPPRRPKPASTGFVPGETI